MQPAHSVPPSSLAPPPPAGRSRGVSCLLAVLLGLCTALVVGVALLTWRTVEIETRLNAPTGRPYVPPTVVPRASLTESEQSTIQTFRAAAPSVVFITSVEMRQDFFRRNIMEIPRGTGSGFVWDAQGHVVTNYHVVQGADSARVTLSDQSVWAARMVGHAAHKDLAVLRIDAPTEKLTPIPVGTSADLEVGQHVLAIGNPFGLDHTLSTGVISGLGREIGAVTGRPITGVVQTDAAINPGNSGGPLLDTSGRLIGINTAIYSPSGASAGIGFAVPVDTVARIVPQLIVHGREIRPSLGVQLAEPHVGARMGIAGAIVLRVEPNSPAERAGLLPTRIDPQTGRILLGDVVVAIDGEAIAEPNDMFRQLDGRTPGEEVVIAIVRGEARMETRVTLAATVDRDL